MGLKWEDVDFKANQINIRRTYNNGQWYKPKTKYSKRRIDIGPGTMADLKKWRVACPPNDLDLIFPAESGGPMNHSVLLRNHFWPALKAAELPKIRWHQLRHTYASLIIEQGESIKYVQEQMGHSSPVVTLEIYAHLLDNKNPEAAAKLEMTLFSHTGCKMVANGADGDQEKSHNALK